MRQEQWPFDASLSLSRFPSAFLVHTFFKISFSSLATENELLGKKITRKTAS